MVRVMYLEASWARALAQVLVGRDLTASRALIARYAALPRRSRAPMHDERA